MFKIKTNISDVRVLFDLVIDIHSNMYHSFCKYQTLKIEMTNIMINGKIYCGDIAKAM